MKAFQAAVLLTLAACIVAPPPPPPGMPFGGGPMGMRPPPPPPGMQGSFPPPPPGSPWGAYPPPPPHPPMPYDPSCRNTNTEANKKLVLEFYQKAFGDHDSSNLEKYLSPNYIEHNPNEGDGIDAVRDLIDNVLAPSPKTKVDFKLVLAERDLVATRNRLDFLGTIYATGDFFRIGCDGKIAEHWDAMQDISQIPPNGPNPHPFW